MKRTKKYMKNIISKYMKRTKKLELNLIIEFGMVVYSQFLLVGKIMK